MTDVVVMGAGPAGLSAAYELARARQRTTVLEADSQVGGLSKTMHHRGFLFDIGGHRFFTKIGLVEQMWRDVLGPELLVRPRLSRIYYRHKFFDYPLRPLNAVRGLGIVESARCTVSYVTARMAPRRPEEDFETWVSNRFGKRLFDIFFRTYTEKVWGLKCREISADWAAQRIQSLSLAAVIKNALIPSRIASRPKSLIERFLYPRRGPGQMWEKTAELVEAGGSRVLLNTPVRTIHHDGQRITAVDTETGSHAAKHFISTLPIRDLIASMRPIAPPSIQHAAAQLRYRDYLAVCLICNVSNLFPDNWIYVHDPDVHVGRIQNYGNWSSAMVPVPGASCLGLEYFCFEGDRLWSMTDAELVQLGISEVAQLGLLRKDQVEEGVVLRVPKAYPVYDGTYKAQLAEIRGWLDQFSNLQLIGRNGMHRYNNQDHSILTGMLAARNILGSNYDLWQINADAEYHETGSVVSEEEIAAMNKSQPAVPPRR